MSDPASTPANTIASQGMPGAYSELACRQVEPGMTTLPCPSFEDAFAAVREGRARLGMIPIDNSVAGRVADIHHLLPESGLNIIGEHFLRVDHHLLGLPGATIAGLTHVHSHVHALGQCRKIIRELGVKAVVRADTAGAAAEIATGGDKTRPKPLLRRSWRGKPMAWFPCGPASRMRFTTPRAFSLCRSQPRNPTSIPGR